MMGPAAVVFLAGAAGATPAQATNGRSREPNAVWMVGAAYGPPGRLSGSFGVAAPLGRGRDTARVVFLLSADLQAGLAGGGLRAGIDAWPRPSSSHLTVGAHAVALRTWGDPLGTEPRRTLLGGDVEVSLARLVWASAGLLAPVGGSGPAKAVRTWSVGVRFPIACFTGCPF